MIRMPFATINNWRALALRRLAHLDELKRSGRWRLLFSSEAALEEALREADANAEKWKRLAHDAERATVSR
jgi:hypothetical protein